MLTGLAWSEKGISPCSHLRQYFRFSFYDIGAEQ